MGRLNRWMRWTAVIALCAWCASCSSCTPTVDTGPSSAPAAQVVRVRLLESLDKVDLTASANPRVYTESDRTQRVLNFPTGSAVTVYLTDAGWRVGNLQLGTGVLVLQPGAEGTIRVNRTAYRGAFRFIPVGFNKFDVVNEVDVEGYLKGVVAREMYPNWHPEAYRAQAIVARTYVLYEAHTAGAGRYWDVWADQRSQVYGGIDGESAKSREAVDATAGIVLAYGDGDGKIFKAYFSSCCGGVTQASADAFPNEPYQEPLSEQFTGTRCNISKHFNWGPITIGKDELTRRIRIWADRRGHQEGRVRPEVVMGMLYRLDIGALNRYGRPTRFLMTDTKGLQYTWTAEEMRNACNADANGGPTLPSSFCKINASPNSPQVTFYDGHGFGHGVGMCQWCAEERASEGQSYAQITLAAFPHAKLVRAY